MPLIRMQKSLFLVAFISSLILSMTAYSTALDKKDPPSEQTPDKQLSYTFAEVRIVFPSSLWKLVREDEKEITFYRRYKTGFGNAVTISVVNLYPSAWGYTREQHIKNYFNNVRLKSRHHEESSGHHEEWSGFVEGTRKIDGVHYPIMRYSIKVNGSQIDGVLMILFPDDLESRHRFYDLRLSEIYHEGKPAPGFPDLEFIVKNLEILPVLGSGAPSSTTGIQKAQAGVFDDFDSGLRVGKDHYGNPIGFITFRDSASSVINISTTSDHPQLPGEEDNNQVLQLDLDAKAWAGVLHRFENAAVNTWTPRDWRGFDEFSFWLYGNNTNTSLFVDILDNRKFRSTTRDTEGYTYTFTDNFSGWKLITVPFKELVRKEIGNDAPNDGLGLSEVHGWAFGTLNTGGSITYYIDDLKILPVKSQPISVDRVWLSPDHTELLLQSSEKNETYYFNNNSDRLCFSFKLPGLWQPSRKSLSLLVIEEPEAHIDLKVGASEEAVVWKGEIGGVWVYSPEELSAHRGVDPVDRASRLIAKIYEEENKAKLTTDKLLPYKSSLPGTKKWKATWSLLIDDQPTQMGAEKIFAEIDPGWVAQISSSNDEIARDILQSLNTSSASDCYTSFIEENFLIE